MAVLDLFNRKLKKSKERDVAEKENEIFPLKSKVPGSGWNDSRFALVMLIIRTIS